MKDPCEIQHRLWPAPAPGALGSMPDDCPCLFPFIPPVQKRRKGAVIVCPGGGYRNLADHEAGPIAEWLNSLGVSAFVLRYRRAPYRHPIPLNDAQRAVRWVRAYAGEWGIDKECVGILGFSAGGHLAASVATLGAAGQSAASDPVERESGRPNAAILCYPVISFLEFGHRGSACNLLGESLSADLCTALSLENRVTVQTPPIFLWHTADDAAVPVENSLLFARALSQHKVPFALHVFPHGAHGLGLARNTTDVLAWTDLCARWLDGIGF